MYVSTGDARDVEDHPALLPPSTDDTLKATTSLNLHTVNTIILMLTQAPTEQYASGLQKTEHRRRKMNRFTPNGKVKEVRARIQMQVSGSTENEEEEAM